jgi:hypothetical protein
MAGAGRDLRLGIWRHLTFAQGIDNAQQPPQAVGSAAIALPGVTLRATAAAWSLNPLALSTSSASA